jgi:ubiquinone/menaquinone biosynthesis C-methylase UbiE
MENKTGNYLKKEKEESFHDLYFSGEGIRVGQAKFYDTKISNTLLEEAYKKVGNIENKKVLYLGCGSNSEIMVSFIKSGAYVVAIDLSKEAVKIIDKAIEERNLSDRAKVIKMDAEQLDFPDESFDVIFGRAIIHHLDIKKANQEFFRVLKKDGRAVFIEPLGNNPFINFYRFLTPQARTFGEHPLVAKDIYNLKNKFEHIEQHNFYLFALLSFIWKMIFKNKSLFQYSFDKLFKFDNFIMRKITFLGKLCWCSIITLYK